MKRNITLIPWFASNHVHQYLASPICWNVLGAKLTYTAYNSSAVKIQNAWFPFFIEHESKDRFPFETLSPAGSPN